MTTTPTNADLRTYLGDADLKARFLEEIGKHEQADMLLKGSYGNGVPDCGFKGCAIGCALHSLNKLQGRPADELAADTGDHERYVTELGLPLWLAYMEDTIFEGLPDELSKTWPRRFAEAIPAGACVDDLVLAKILRWTLSVERFGVRFATEDAAVVAVVDRMSSLFDRVIRGDEPTSKEWDDAERDAWDARDARAARDAWAAWAARDAWAAWAARDAWAAWDAWDAWDARDARAARDAWAAWAARDAWDAWDARAADTRDAFYPALSEYVLQLLRELPVLSEIVTA